MALILIKMTRFLLLGAGLSAACAGLSLADDDAETPLGSVAETIGPSASVIVLRGANSYELSEGDFLFRGDKVFTRQGATVVLRIDGCKVELPETSFIEVNDQTCVNHVQALKDENALMANTGSANGQSSGIGASPALIPLLAAGGAAAATAGASSGGSSGSQPESVLD